MNFAEPTTAAENAAAAAISAALKIVPMELTMKPSTLTCAGAIARALVRQLGAGHVTVFFSPGRGGVCLSVAGVPDGEPSGSVVEITVVMCKAEAPHGAELRGWP